MIEIDFEALKHADFEVVNGPRNPELDKAFSAFLRERHAKEAQSGETAVPRSKKARSLPAKRKNVRAVAK
jgi:hypothetical protein